MAKPLNFNTMKKRYLPVTFNDEKNTTIMVGMPNKSLMRELVAIQAVFEDYNEDDVSVEVVDELYEVCAKVMRRNKCNVEITTEFVEEAFDIEDVMTFFSAYMNFVGEMSTAKN